MLYNYIMRKMDEGEIFRSAFDQVARETGVKPDVLKQRLDTGARAFFLATARLQLIKEGGGSIPPEIAGSLENLNAQGKNIIAQYGEDFFNSTLNAYTDLLRDIG